MRHRLILSLLVLGVAMVAVADDRHDQAASTATNPGFEILKTLVGTWVAADEKGKPTEEVFSVVKLTAGGSAIQETQFPGQPHEMVSLYTAEGPDIVMTHYCMLGNQPRMKAAGASAVDKLNFEFAGGTNLNPAKDKHMHSAVLRFVDNDHIEIDGVGWEDGKPAQDMCSGMKLIRKK